ncbi:hypothetical protein D3C79_941050 [compost metagenome]
MHMDVGKLMHEREPEVVVAVVSKRYSNNGRTLRQLEGTPIHFHRLEARLHHQKHAIGLSQNIDQRGDVFRLEAQERDLPEVVSAQPLEIRHPPAQHAELGLLVDQRQPGLDLGLFRRVILAI